MQLFFKGRSAAAFTLAEVLIAGFLMTIIILVLIGLSISLLRGTQKASDTTGAQVASEHILNSLIYDVQPGSPSHGTFWASSSFSRPGTYRMNRTDFSYQIDASSVIDSTGSPIGSGFAQNRLKQVQLSVYWWDSEHQASTREGYGKLEFHTVRLLAEGASQ
jgi:Tfp pilus assembly protein PilV